LKHEVNLNSTLDGGSCLTQNSCPHRQAVNHLKH